MIIAQINAKLQPIHRGDIFEDPLDSALKKAGRGEVTGGGTLLDNSGEIAHCDIEISVPEVNDENLRFIATTLEGLGAPKGSRLTMAKSDKVLQIGKAEGLAVYLNGTDLPDEVYAKSDINFVISEFTRLLGAKGRILSNWQGPRETALYIYGGSFAGMRDALKDFIASYPLCQKCRIVQIA